MLYSLEPHHCFCESPCFYISSEKRDYINMLPSVLHAKYNVCYWKKKGTYFVSVYVYVWRIYLFMWKSELNRERERQRSFICFFTPQKATVDGVSQAEAKIQEFHQHLPHGWQGSNVLNHFLLFFPDHE